MPLIKDKATYVRAHVQTTNPQVRPSPSRCACDGFRAGIELPAPRSRR